MRVPNLGNTMDEEGVQSHTWQLQLLQFVRCGRVYYPESREYFLWVQILILESEWQSSSRVVFLSSWICAGDMPFICEYFIFSSFSISQIASHLSTTKGFTLPVFAHYQLLVQIIKMAVQIYYTGKGLWQRFCLILSGMNCLTKSVIFVSKPPFKYAENDLLPQVLRLWNILTKIHNQIEDWQ